MFYVTDHLLLVSGFRNSLEIPIYCPSRIWSIEFITFREISNFEIVSQEIHLASNSDKKDYTGWRDADGSISHVKHKSKNEADCG
jgi:hypothetical protein